MDAHGLSCVHLLVGSIRYSATLSSLSLSLSLSLSNVEEAILSCLLKDFTWLESRFSFPWYLDSQFIHGDFFSALKFSRTL